MASFENLKAWQALIVSTKSEPAFSQNPLSAALPGVDLGIPEGKREKLRLRSSPLAIRIVFTVGRVALTGCRQCFFCIPERFFSRRAEEAWNPQDDENKNSFPPLPALCRSTCLAAVGHSHQRPERPGKRVLSAPERARTG
jgi:hypothetical protein